MSQQQNYNTSYYETHKSQLQARAKLRERKNRADARKFRACIQSALHAPTTTPILNYAGATVSLALVGLLTFILLREMTAFYAESDSILNSWIKAVALEGAVIWFSFSTHKLLLHRILYKAIALAICLFSIYAMASKQVGLGLDDIQSKQINSRAISDAEKAIEAKSAQRDYFMTNGWVTAARKTEAAIDLLRSKLETLRASALKSKPISATTHSTAAAVIFRLLLMVANILAAQRLGEIFRNFKSQVGILEPEVKLSKMKPEISRTGKPQQKREVSRGEQFQFWEWFSGEGRARA